MSYFSHHALVRDYTESEVVDSEAVVLAAHYFWRHVARSAARVLVVLSLLKARDAEVSHTQVAMLVKDQILRFNVSMDNTLRVNVLEPL